MNRPLQRKTQMKRVSSKRARELRQYAKQRKAFLAKPENRWCVVAASGRVGRHWTGATVFQRATEVHHQLGRNSKLLLDEKYWMAISRPGHDWINENQNEARKLGWVLDKRVDDKPLVHADSNE